MNAFPSWFQPVRYVGLSVLTVLTATCTSEPFSTNGSTVATQLAFTASPGSAVAGKAFTPAVVVEARDAHGRLASSFTGDVTVVIGANPGAGTLSGTATVAAVAGRATFSNLSIDRVGSGYLLTASGASLTPATSAALTITPGTATQLVFTVQPSNTTAGADISPRIKVTALDAFGNTASGLARTITVAIGANPTGASLSGDTIAVTAAGHATFFFLRINKSGPGYTLVAAAAGLTGATSAPFNIDTGPAATLAFTVQPTVARFSCPRGLALAPFRLTVTDAVGNAIVSDTREVHIALGSTWAGSSLYGTTTAAAVAGVATFSDVTVDANTAVPFSYTLVATASGLTATSAWVTVPTDLCWPHFTFSVQPVNTVAGAVITPAVVVTARDNQGNTATWFTGYVTIAIGSNPSGGTLSGTATVAFAAGVATFSTLSINLAGTGYTLTAFATGLAAATSAAFNITPPPSPP